MIRAAVDVLPVGAVVLAVLVGMFVHGARR
jgi:hypothetical protein